MTRGIPGLFLGAAFALIAKVAGADGACLPGTEVGRLVSMIGDVRINGVPPVGELPFVPMCAGDLITVGTRSRAGIYLLDADTPVRLDQDTVARIEATSTPDSGLFDLTRGAIYFLSQVRRTLTIRTPYVNAGIEGTEVYLRVREAAAELIVLEGEVALVPGAATLASFAPATVATGEQAEVAATGVIERTTLPSPGGPFGALREVAVGALSWTLFYPDVLTGANAAQYPRISQAARLLAAGQVANAEAVLAATPVTGPEAGLGAALRAIIAVGRKDVATASQFADRAVALALTSPVPQLALSYARQLALDLDGAFAAAEAAARLGPDEPVPRARLAEIHLMRGETRQARKAAATAVKLGGGPLAEIIQGFADLAALRGARAEQSFRRALAGESQNPLALLGLGLAQIKQGDIASGIRQIESAVLHEPVSSLLRSYLGRGYFQDFRMESAAKQYTIAKALDPADPTPWFYDGIRKQIENRPIEALRDIERSIALNDNRAPFRSRLLLDEDLATRGASLGRIYDDLGFRQLGINEAMRSLAADPASAAAHRFLSDLYSAQPRLESARLSAQLQAQLLQPVGMNPVQPSLAFSNLGVLRNSGPSRVSFNEYNRVFQQDGLQLDGTFVGGSDDTLGNEAAISGLIDRFSFSLGQFYYRTDGSQQNDYLTNQIYSAFGQIALTEDFDVQLGFAHRNSDRGDREQRAIADPDPRLRKDRDEALFLLGGKYRVSPSGSFLFAGIAGEEDARSDTSLVDNEPTSKLRGELDRSGKQFELQYIHDFGPASLVGGAGAYSTNGELRIQGGELFFGEDLDSQFDADQNGAFGYGYANIEPFDRLGLVAGLGFERYDEPRHSDTRLLPKLGVTWSPASWLTLRSAAFESLNRGTIAEQTLEPVQIAGFSQLVDDFPGSRSRTYALGVDLRGSAQLSFGVEVAHRDITPPVKELFPLTNDGETLLQDQDEDALRAYVYFTPTDHLALTAAFEVAKFRRDASESRDQPAEVDQYSVPLSVRYFHPTGFFAGLAATYLSQSVSLESEGSGTLKRRNTREDFVSIDSVMGWRLFDSRIVLSLEGYNLLDQQIDYQDTIFRTPVQANPDEQPLPFFVNSRTLLMRLTVEFGT